MPFSVLLDDVVVAYKRAICLDDNKWLEQEINAFVQHCHEDAGNGIDAIIRFFEDARAFVCHQQELSQDEVIEGFFLDVQTLLNERAGVDAQHFAGLRKQALENKKETPASVLATLLEVLSDQKKRNRHKKTLGLLLDIECHQLVIKYKSYCLYQQETLNQLYQQDYFYVPLLKDFIDGTCKFISGFVDTVRREKFVNQVALLSRSTENLYDFFLQYDAIMKPLLAGAKGGDVLILLSPLLSKLTQKLNPQIKITNVERKSIELPEGGCFLTLMHHLRVAYFNEKLEPYLNTQQRELLMSLFCYLRSTDPSSANIPHTQQLISDILQRPHLRLADLLAMPGYAEDAIAANQGMRVKANGVLNGWQKQYESSTVLSSVFSVFKAVTHDSRLMMCLDLYRNDKQLATLSEQDVAKNRRTIDGFVAEIFAASLDVYHINNLKTLLPQLDTEGETKRFGVF